METRLIIAYVLLFLLGLVALAGAIVVARARITGASARPPQLLSRSERNPHANAPGLS
jgi:hypothetical protein